jgi:hypothetical protein
MPTYFSRKLTHFRLIKLVHPGYSAFTFVHVGGTVGTGTIPLLQQCNGDRRTVPVCTLYIAQINTDEREK